MSRANKKMSGAAVMVIAAEGEHKYIKVNKVALRVRLVDQRIEAEILYPRQSTWTRMTLYKGLKEYSLCIPIDPDRYTSEGARVSVPRLVYKLWVDPTFDLFYTTGSALLRARDGNRYNCNPANWEPLRAKRGSQPKVPENPTHEAQEPVGATEPQAQQAAQTMPEQPITEQAAQPVPEQPSTEQKQVQPTTEQPTSIYRALIERAVCYTQLHIACQAALYAALANSSKAAVATFKARGHEPNAYCFMGMDSDTLELGCADSQPVRINLSDAPEFI